MQMLLLLLQLVAGAQLNAALQTLVNSPGDIGRVTESLNALIDGIADETKARIHVTQGTASWCEDTIALKKDTIRKTDEGAEQAKVDLEAADADRAAAEQKVSDIKSNIVQEDTALGELEKKFDGMKADHKKALAEIATARENIEASLLSRGSNVQRKMVATSDSLEALRKLDTQLLNSPSFLQVSTKKEVDDASSNAEEDLDHEQELLDQDWKKEQGEHGKLHKAKKNEIAELEADLQSAQLTVSQAQTNSAMLTRQQGAATRTSGRETKLLAGIEASCTATADFAAAQELLRTQQSDGLRNALDLLRAITNAVLTQFSSTSFVQLSASDNMFSFMDAGLKLQSQASTQTDTATTEQATEESGLDPLADIKGKIQGMLDALVAAENAEKGPKNFCSDEMSTNRDKLRTKQNDIDRYKAEERAALITMSAFKQTQQGASLGRNQVSAEKSRTVLDVSTRESRVGDEAKDHKLCMEVLDKAVSLIKDEFGLGTSLLQTQSTSKEISAQKVVDALDGARELFVQQNNEAATFISGMVARTDTVIADLDGTMRAQDQEIAEAKSGEAEQLDQAAQAKESAHSSSAELAVVKSYMENLGQQCGPKLGNSYEELKQQRQEEIDGLKEGLKVLEGEAVPVMSLSQTDVLVGKTLSPAMLAAKEVGLTTVDAY